MVCQNHQIAEQTRQEFAWLGICDEWYKLFEQRWLEPVQVSDVGGSMLSQCKTIDLPRIHDPRGNLTYIEGGRHVPFEIQRVYYLYDVPGGAERGGHAHKALHQLIVAMSGSFDIHLDDGRETKLVHMNRSYYGLYVCPMIWREIDNFSSGAVCMVLASNYYSEDDYYRDYPLFKADALADK